LEVDDQQSVHPTYIRSAMEESNDHARRVGELLLDPAEAVNMPAPGKVKAAVLVPLYLQDDHLTVVFTKRPADMRRHAGEISFPGGCPEPGVELTGPESRERR